MRQRTLGIMAAAFLLAGFALGAGTAIYAHQTASTAPALHRGPLHGPGRAPGGFPGRPGAPRPPLAN